MSRENDFGIPVILEDWPIEVGPGSDLIAVRTGSFISDTAVYGAQFPNLTDLAFSWGKQKSNT